MSTPERTIVDVVEYTDVQCVWSWSSEPKLRWLRARYGEQLRWRRVFGVLVHDIGGPHPDEDPHASAEAFRAGWLRSRVTPGRRSALDRVDVDLEPSRVARGEGGRAAGSRRRRSRRAPAAGGVLRCRQGGRHAEPDRGCGRGRPRSRRAATARRRGHAGDPGRDPRRLRGGTRSRPRGDRARACEPEPGCRAARGRPPALRVPDARLQRLRRSRDRSRLAARHRLRRRGPTRGARRSRRARCRRWKAPTRSSTTARSPSPSSSCSPAASCRRSTRFRS